MAERPPKHEILFFVYVVGSRRKNDCRTYVGWTAVAGLDFRFAGRWSAKAEYLYVDLGEFDCDAGCGASHTVAASQLLLLQHCCGFATLRCRSLR